MNVASTVVIFLQTGLVLSIALAACLAAKSKPAIRLAICRVTLLTLIGLCLWRPWNHTNPSPVVPIHFATTSMAVSMPTFGPKPTPMSRVMVKPTTQQPKPPQMEAYLPSPHQLQIHWAEVILFAWFGGTALLTINLLLGAFSLARLSKKSSTLTDPRILAIARSLATKAAIRTPRLLICPETQGLFVSGVFKPTIFIPQSLLGSLDDGDLTAVLGHEIAHIANGDLLWGIVRRVIAIALWWQPLIWFIRKPMETASEELCDRRVLNSGISQERYADCLLTLRERVGSRAYPSLSIGAVSGRSSLGARIEAILDPTTPAATRLPRSVASAIFCVGFVVAFGVPHVFGRPILKGQPETIKGRINEPYATTIQLSDRQGKPVLKAAAWLVLGGSSSQVIHLKVSGSTVTIPKVSIAPDTSGTVVVHASGLALGFERLWPAEKEAGPLVLGESSSIKGSVETQNHQPIAGLHLSATHILLSTTSGPLSFAALRQISDLGINAVSDSRGQFQLHDLPMGSQVGIDHQDNRYTSSDNYPYPVVSKNPASLAAFVLRPGAEITGQVLREGKPVAGVRVGAQARMSDWGECQSDVNGRFKISRLNSGTYNVAVDLPSSLESQLTTVAHEGVRVNAGQTIANLDFNLIPGAVIRGQVIQEDDTPLAHTHVGIYGPAHPSSTPWVQSVLTDGDGYYMLRVPAGKQSIYCQDRAPLQITHVTLADGSTTEVDLRVPNADDPTGYPGSNDRPVIEEPRAQDTRSVSSFSPEEINQFKADHHSNLGRIAPNYGPQKLTNGIAVSLGYVQDDSLQGPHTPWAPSGGPLSVSEKARSLTMGSLLRSKSKSSNRAVYFGMKFSGRNAKEDEFACKVKTPINSDWNGWQGYIDTEGRTGDMATISVPRTLIKTDILFGVAAGPFKTVAESKINAAPFYAKAGKGGTEGGFKWSTSIEVPTPASIRTEDMLVEAFDKNGKSLNLVSWSVPDGPQKGNVTTTWNYNGAEPQDVATVRVKVRDYEWSLFKAVHLYSDSSK